jgi:hypothetical protein
VPRWAVRVLVFEAPTTSGRKGERKELDRVLGANNRMVSFIVPVAKFLWEEGERNENLIGYPCPIAVHTFQ